MLAPLSIIRASSCLDRPQDRPYNSTVPFAHSHGANTDILDCERAGSRKSLSMSGVWVLLGLGVLAMIVKTAGWSHGRADRSNLGFVSARWLAEQRLSQSQDHK